MANRIQRPGPGHPLGLDGIRGQAGVLVHPAKVRDGMVADEEVHAPGARDQRPGQGRPIDVGHPGSDHQRRAGDHARRTPGGGPGARLPALPSHPARGQGDKDKPGLLGERAHAEQYTGRQRTAPGDRALPGHQQRHGCRQPKNIKGLAPQKMAEGDEVRVEGDPQSSQQTRRHAPPTASDPVGGQDSQARGQHVDEFGGQHRNPQATEPRRIRRNGAGRPGAVGDARPAQGMPDGAGKIFGFIAR